MKSRVVKGFTLIELLIVVAIIAILAAIAIPNFLAAQVRAKISRSKGELRTIATGLESYYVDNNVYPNDGTEAWVTVSPEPTQKYWYVPNSLTTPISYVTNASAMKDPFRGTRSNGDPEYTRYRYSRLGAGSVIGGLQQSAPSAFANYSDAYGDWRLVGLGPDQAYSPDQYTPRATPWGSYDVVVAYDPTNGTVSYGDLIRSSKCSDGYTR